MEATPAPSEEPRTTEERHKLVREGIVRVRRALDDLGSISGYEHHDDTDHIPENSPWSFLLRYAKGA